MNKYRYLLLLFCLPLSLLAQAPGHHDILLLQLNKNTAGFWQASVPKFLTAFNPSGYNNQPKFFPDGSLWISAQTATDLNQTDIYALNLSLNTITRVTATTKTAEYSPTPVPGKPRFSAVRVEEDGNQRLWTFPTDRSDNGRVEFSSVFNVGYHCWLGNNSIAFFIVGDNEAPHTLQVMDLETQKLRQLASNIGRCLLQTEDGKLAFVQKPTQQTWFLKTWNPANNNQDILLKMPNEVEDFAILPDGTYLCGEGANLLYFKPGRDNNWNELANLAKYGVKKITRLDAAKNGKLAVVVE